MAPRLKKGERLLRSVHPNAGIEADYRKRLRRLVEAMHKAVLKAVTAAYSKNEPELIEAIDEEKDQAEDHLLEALAHDQLEGIIAQDVLPSRALQRAIRRLIRIWQRRFDTGAPKLAAWFAQSAAARSDRMLAQILREAGFSVEFRMTRAQRDVLNATIQQNVSLIRSIPQQYLSQVEGIVMRSVQRGGDLRQLSRELQVQFWVTRRRAVFIARDQNIKAVSALTRARQIEIGVKEAVWMHSHAGKEPRKTHLANDGNRYVVSEGWYDPDPRVRRNIYPGELINCRCTSKSIVKGL